MEMPQLNSFEKGLVTKFESAPDADHMWFETFLNAKLPVIKHMVEAHGLPEPAIALPLAARRARFDILHYLVDELGLKPAEKSRFYINRSRQNVEGLCVSDDSFHNTRELVCDMAAESASLEMVKYCIEVLGCPSKNCLYTASRVGNLDMVKYLVGLGEKPSTMSLGSAIVAGNLEMVKYLMDEHHLDASSYDLLAAAKSGNTELLRYLASVKGVKLPKYTVDLLETAVEQGNLEMVKYLIEELNISEKTNYSQDSMIFNASIFESASDYPEIFEYVGNAGCLANANLNDQFFARIIALKPVESIRYLATNCQSFDVRNDHRWLEIAIWANASPKVVDFFVHEMECRPDSEWFVQLIRKLINEWIPEEIHDWFLNQMRAMRDAVFDEVIPASDLIENPIYRLKLAIELATKLNPEAFTLIKETFQDDALVQKILFEMFEGVKVHEEVPLVLYLVQAIRERENAGLLMQFLPYFSIASPKIILRLIDDILGNPEASKESILSALELYKST